MDGFFRAVGILVTGAIVPVVFWFLFVWYGRVTEWRDRVNNRLSDLERGFEILDDEVKK